MKRTRSYPLLVVSSLFLLVLSACGPAAPATPQILPTAPPPTAIPPPTDIPTPAPTPTPAAPVYPPERAIPQMVYDSKADTVLMFGGGGTSMSGPYTDETWLYDPQANTWTNVTPQE